MFATSLAVCHTDLNLPFSHYRFRQTATERRCGMRKEKLSSGGKQMIHRKSENQKWNTI